MRVFNWELKVGSECIAEGSVLAEDKKHAEFKLRGKLPYYDKNEDLILDNGYEINADGIVVRYERRNI